MKDPRTWIIIGLTIIVILLILLDKDPVDSTGYVKEYESTIQKNEVRIKELTDLSTKQAEKIKSDSIRQANEKINYLATIKNKSREIADLRANPKVVQIIAENPEIENLIDQFVNQDMIKTARIDTLESNLKELRVDLAGVTANFEETLQLERDKFQNQKAISDSYQKENKKLRRGNKLLKVVAVVGAVGAFLLGSK